MSKIHEIVVRLKSGREFTIFCEDCEVTRNGLGGLEAIEFKNPKNIKPFLFYVEDVELMYEVLQPKEEEEER